MLKRSLLHAFSLAPGFVQSQCAQAEAYGAGSGAAEQDGAGIGGSLDRDVDKTNRMLTGLKTDSDKQLKLAAKDNHLCILDRQVAAFSMTVAGLLGKVHGKKQQLAIQVEAIC